MTKFKPGDKVWIPGMVTASVPWEHGVDVHVCVSGTIVRQAMDTSELRRRK